MSKRFDVLAHSGIAPRVEGGEGEQMGPGQGKMFGEREYRVKREAPYQGTRVRAGR